MLSLPKTSLQEENSKFCSFFVLYCIIFSFSKVKKSYCCFIFSAITCMIWPLMHSSELLYGCADGSLNVGVMKKGKRRVNHSYQMFESQSHVLKMAIDPEGGYVVTSHINKSLYIFQLGNDGKNKTEMVFFLYNVIKKFLFSLKTHLKMLFFWIFFMICG